MTGGYRPWSKFNAHSWSILNARRHYSGPFRPEVTKIVVNELDWDLSLTQYQTPKSDAHKRLLQWRRRGTNAEVESNIEYELPIFR